MTIRSACRILEFFVVPPQLSDTVVALVDKYEQVHHNNDCDCRHIDVPPDYECIRRQKIEHVEDEGYVEHRAESLCNYVLPEEELAFVGLYEYDCHEKRQFSENYGHHLGN